MQQFALVFTCSPEQPVLTVELLAECGAIAGFPDDWQFKWLAEGISCETILSVDRETAVRAREAIRDVVGDRAIDVNLAVADNTRRKSLLIADMDSTIIQQECVDELAQVAGVGARVRGITERAMRGEIDFEGALRERVGLLAGLHDTDLQRVLDNQIELMPGAATLVTTMTAHGAHCALVSGGFTWFTSAIAKQVGFAENRANILEFDGEILSGKVADPILGREAKLAALKEMLASRDLDTTASVAIGDGANDLAMIGHAGLGVAYRAKPLVAAEADASIVHGDLTAVLYLQGYTANEFHVN